MMRKSAHLRFGTGFKVALTNARAQAAQMTLPPGDSEGDASNAHRGADQWLFVVEGRGVAIVNGRRVRLREGSLLLIQRGDRHEVRNDGRAMLRTLNLYVPPAYNAAGVALTRGRRARRASES